MIFFQAHIIIAKILKAQHRIGEDYEVIEAFSPIKAVATYLRPPSIDDILAKYFDLPIPLHIPEGGIYRVDEESDQPCPCIIVEVGGVILAIVMAA